MTLDIDAIKARADAATEGPWGVEDARVIGDDGRMQVCALSGSRAWLPDALFIAHARADVPALVAEVERLQAIVERVRKLHAPEVRTVSVPVFDEFDSPTQTDTYCAGCGGWGSSQKLHRLCQTVRALEGL